MEYKLISDRPGYIHVINFKQCLELHTYNHRGSQLYFHITSRQVCVKRREDTFFAAQSESRISAPFFASKTV